jgi:hypothetical protein
MIIGDGRDYFLDLYGFFRRWAGGHRLGLAHVRVCNSRGNNGPGWHISGGVHSAIQEKLATFALGGLVNDGLPGQPAPRRAPGSK